jgi:energy-coupling factor transporter ATP-binding protein EcfA2
LQPYCRSEPERRATDRVPGITGAYARSVRGPQLREELERVYAYFPRLKTRRASLAGYTSGGEQQMVAIGRAMMAKPSMLLLDEPSMGLAPQIVAEIFEIVRDLNQKEGVSILLAEQNTNVAPEIRRLRLHPGKRPYHDGRPGQGTGREQGRQGVLSRNVVGRPPELPRPKILSTPETVALAFVGINRIIRSSLVPGRLVAADFTLRFPVSVAISCFL